MALLKSQAKAGNPILQDVLKEFIIDRRLGNLSPSTAEFYQRRIGEFLKPCMDKPLVELTLQDVRDRIGSYQDESYSPATVNGYKRATKALLNWALSDDYDIQVVVLPGLY